MQKMQLFPFPPDDPERGRLLAELRWLLRAYRKQRALALFGLAGLPAVDTVSSGKAY